MRRISASPPTRSMCSSATASSTLRKWCDTSAVTAGRSSRNAATSLSAASASSAACSRIGSRMWRSNISTARSATARAATLYSAASASRSLIGRPASSKRKPCRTRLTSAEVNRSSPSILRPSASPARSIARSNADGTPLRAATSSKVRNSSSSLSLWASATAVARSASARLSFPSTTRLITASVRPFCWSARMRRTRCRCSRS